MTKTLQYNPPEVQELVERGADAFGESRGLTGREKHLLGAALIVLKETTTSDDLDYLIRRICCNRLVNGALKSAPISGSDKYDPQ